MRKEVIPVKTEVFSGVAAKSPLGDCIRSVLRRALIEKRLTIGLMPTLQYLSTNCNRALFCFTTEATPGDSATHMQEVLLQAFCVENDIFIVKVDSAQKMRHLLCSADSREDFGCVLVHCPYTDPFADDNILTPSEFDLVQYCEAGNYQAVIKLPEK